MRHRVAVEWDGVTVEDQVHFARSLRIGAGPNAAVTVPGPAGVYMRLEQQYALSVLDIPVSLVSSIRWEDGDVEDVLSDRSLALSPQHGTCELTLRESFTSEHPTRVRIAALVDLPARRDVALAGWTAAALFMGTYLAAGIAYTHESKHNDLSPSELTKAGLEDRTEQATIHWIVDPALPLSDDQERLGAAGMQRSDADQPLRYSYLLSQGFERYVKSDLDGAEQAWTEAALTLAERPEAYINLAQVAKRRSNFAAAESLLQRALGLSPGRCEALTDLGLIEAAAGKVARGKHSLSVALSACAPRVGFAKLNLAAVLSDAGEPVLAQRMLHEAVTALVVDTADKRREALFDLDHEPLFARLRLAETFPQAVEALRASLRNPS